MHSNNRMHSSSRIHSYNRIHSYDRIHSNSKIHSRTTGYTAGLQDTWLNYRIHSQTGCVAGLQDTQRYTTGYTGGYVAGLQESSPKDVLYYDNLGGLKGEGANQRF